LSPATHSAELQWRSLNPQPSLKGWSVRGGKAPFAVEGEDLVGRSILGSPNSFLVTDATFGDFILEYDAKVDPRLNSGVMVRAERRADYRNGVVFGYQVEIDSSARAWSGGIYDEQRREWLNTLSRNPQARAAFKVGEWNHFRVEALGHRIRTFVNGVAAANLVDDMTARGFIGLQVHSVDEGPKVAGLEARFRNIRILTKDAAAAASPIDPAAEEYNYLPNRLTEAQVAQGWRLLWDGVSTSGWRGANLVDFPDHGWSIRDGVLSVDAATGGESTNGGDIVTREEFANFELELDFRITPGANSGIKYFVDPKLGPTLGLKGSAIGLEFQILDDERHPDAKLGVRGNRTIGSLYDLIPAANLDEPNRTKRVLPPGEWNRARIVAVGRHVEHWLNGVKVVEYDRGTQMFRALVNNSKYKDMPGFGELERGPILLQDHGNAVSFRSIKIRPL
jgi:3-keto-disaccharide hydrolase